MAEFNGLRYIVHQLVEDVRAATCRASFLEIFGETVCRQCLCSSIIRRLRVAFHLQSATVPSREDLSVEHSLENSFAGHSCSSSHPSSIVRCRSQLNVCMRKDHFVCPLQLFTAKGRSNE
jgi:hypothetical protein